MLHEVQGLLFSCSAVICFIFEGDQLENVTEACVMEGLVEVKRGGIKANE